VRKLALERLAEFISSVENSNEASFEVLTPESLKEFKTMRPGVLEEPRTTPLPKKDYLRRLKSVHKAIVDERRGAYANWFQDPTYLAVFVPSSISAILSLIASYWLKK
jgi:hypothetical protein